jgi:hypothetical protein
VDAIAPAVADAAMATGVARRDHHGLVQDVAGSTVA